MKKDIIIHKIKSVPIPESVVEPLYEMSTVLNIKTGENIVSVGDKPKGFYLTLKGGFIERYYNYYQGTLHSINFFLPESTPLMGNKRALLLGEECDSQIQAMKNSYALLFPLKKWNALMEEKAEFKEFVLNGLVLATLHESTMKSILITYKPEQIYKYLLKNHPEIPQNVPTKYIAEFIGISRSYLSTLKSHMH